MKKLLNLSIYLLIALCLDSVCQAQNKACAMKITTDHRGLVTIPGLLKMNSESSWGAANLVIKPYGGWAAQDYSLKNTKKSDGLVIADFMSNPEVKMEQTYFKTKYGSLHVNYKLTPADKESVSYEQVYVFFPVASKDFAGGKLLFDNGEDVMIPEEPGKNIEIPKDSKAITIMNEKSLLKIKTDNMKISFHDMRPESSAFQIWLDYPDPHNKSSIEFDFEVIAEMVPYTMKADGEEWVEFPVTLDIEKGSIMDFSFMCDAPAGKYGRIINKDGHYTYEQSGKRVKLVGANLCYTANYISKSEVDKLAQRFQMMGYNTVRFHHTDVYLIKDNWESNKSDDIDPDMLDRLDYMFAAMKKAGMYITIDLYAQGRYDIGEIEGIDKVVMGDIKGLVPIYEPAFEAWKKMAVKWMNHVNPYTGIAWKDDPALISICPLNEDTIFSVFGSDTCKPLYLKRFEEWKKEHNLVSKVDKYRNDPLFAQFLLEVKMESNRKIEAFLRELGVKAMLTGCNWWDTMGQTFTRDQFDLVDNHQYSDHPSPWYLPAKYNQRSNLQSSYMYMTPILMASTRIFGKPFSVSEYNYCPPNKYRAEGGAFMGAYAALQDWDALYRFAWSHSSNRVNQVSAMYGFDISTDPISQLSERQIVLMFGRGDVSAGKEKYVYGVTMADATKDGVGNMWSKGLFPEAFNNYGVISQTGSQIIEGSRSIEGEFDAVVTGKPVKDSEKLNGNKNIVVKDLKKVSDYARSDTGEIYLNNKNDYLMINTPRTKCAVVGSGDNPESDGFSVSNSTCFCSVSASAMDGNDLKSSERILILYLTDVLNTGMQFASENRNILIKRGEIPFIIRTGSVDVVLQNNNPDLKLYACDLSGKRMKEIKTDYVDGVYNVKLQITADTPYMVYELATD